MSDTEAIAELQMKLTHLERHLAEQDSEIYRLSKRLEVLVKLLQSQQAKIEALSEGGAGAPTDEKPPHY